MDNDADITEVREFARRVVEDNPGSTKSQWMGAVMKHFRGGANPLVVAKALSEFEVLVYRSDK